MLNLENKMEYGKNIMKMVKSLKNLLLAKQGKEMEDKLTSMKMDK